MLKQTPLSCLCLRLQLVSTVRVLITTEILSLSLLVKLPALFLIPPPVNVGGCLNHEDFLHLPSCSSECPAAAGRAREVEQSSQQREGWTRQRGKWTERGGSLTNKTFPASHRIPATEFLHEPLSPADTRHQSQAAANVTLLVDKMVYC